MIGKILAEYRIAEELGGQAGNEVYKAIGFDAQSPVAIKLFPREWSHDRPRLQAFLDSLRKISGLDQPGIPRLIGSGLIGGRAYIITPFMTGGSLQDRLVIGQISPADSLKMLEKIAAALGKAHALGVVHGHFSSAEVMFDGAGQPQIIGLGQTPIDLNGSDSAVRSTDGEHIAPEVRSGGRPTPASDQYSMAVLAFELLTGECVHEVSKAADPAGSDGRAASASRINLAPAVAKVLQRALQDNPSQRYPSLSVMISDLRQAVGGPASERGTQRVAPAPRRDTPRMGRTLSWGMASLAVVAFGCFTLTVPAMAAARWMHLDLKSVTNLLTSQPSAAITMPAPDPPQEDLPAMPPLLSTPISADGPQALIPTPQSVGDLPEPTQAEDDKPAQPAPTELAAADDPGTDQDEAVMSEPGDALPSGPIGADPTQTISPTPTQKEPERASPTAVPPQSTPTSWFNCSDASGQGCMDTVPAR
jgi:serine/threonine protein kinase